MFTNLPVMQGAVPNGPAEITFPLYEQKDTTHLQIKQKMVAHNSVYRRLPLNTRMSMAEVNITNPQLYPRIFSAYLVEETIPRAIGSLLEWERIYITTPADRISYEVYSYTFPGRSNAGTFFSANPISQSLVYNIATNQYRLKLNFSTAPAVAVGDNVIVNYSGFWFGSGGSYNQQVLAVAGNSIELNSLYGDRAVASIQGEPTTRLPFNENVPSRIVYQYYNTTDENTIPLALTFRIVDNSNGGVTDTVSASSNPTAAQYSQMVATRSLICIEPTTITRYNGWGVIWEAKTRFVTAS